MPSHPQTVHANGSQVCGLIILSPLKDPCTIYKTRLLHRVCKIPKSPSIHVGGRREQNCNIPVKAVYDIQL